MVHNLLNYWIFNIMCTKIKKKSYLKTNFQLPNEMIANWDQNNH